MSLSRHLARPLLAAPFIAEGVETLRDPAPRVKVSEDVARRIAAQLGWPKDPELLIKVNAGIQVGAGAMLALGKFRRLSALLLIGSTIPTTYAEHRFWVIDDPAERARQQTLFLKGVGLLGGLLLELLDTEGAPSLGWRARRTARRVGEAVPIGGDSGRPAQVADWVSHSAGGAASAVGTGAQVGLSAGGRALATARDRSTDASRALATAKDRSAGASRAVIGAGSERASSLLSTGAKQAEGAIHGVIDRLPIS